MKTNIGTIDRILRATLGLILLFLAFASGLQIFADPLFKYGTVAFGIVMLATSMAKMCPLYSVLGLKTCRKC